jgi:hypothetical protein
VSDAAELALRAALIGARATALSDLWGMLVARVTGVPGLDYRLIGRWLGHMPRGWVAHYAIGIAASRRPRPNIARLRSLALHLVFGVGLYLSALVTARA